MSRPGQHPVIFWLQLASISAMWLFVLGISYWIVHLLLLSHRLQDVPSASVGISIVAIPIFMTGAGVLTYVFFGLRRGARTEPGEDGDESDRGATVASWIAALCILTAGAHAGELAIPDNPLRGRQLFESKGCHACHGLAGSGHGVGPDLGSGHYSGSFMELGAALWNHVPGMSTSFAATETAWPELSASEATDLLAFLYFIDYLGRPGVAARGRDIFADKGCFTCHRMDGSGADVGPDLSTLERFASPLFIAHAIWNHGPSMFETMREAEVSAPTFREGDLADLSAFIRQQSRGEVVERGLLAPGNPNRGAALFTSKGCSICHGAEAHGGNGGPDLHQTDLHRSAEAIAGSMWNHAQEMDTRRKQLGLGWPILTTEELADLAAFLYFLPFRSQVGDPVRGADVFAARSCEECHGGNALALSELVTSPETASPAAFVAAMWSHAPLMSEAILTEGKLWPELSGEELGDLLAFIERTRAESQ